MEPDAATIKKVQELQTVEQNLQNTVMQKQVFQIEANELLNALAEVARSKDEVYKVMSSIMLRTEKEELIKELTEKKRVLELRVAVVEKQEKTLSERARKLHEEVSAALKEKKK